jgi:hypothetical protein
MLEEIFSYLDHGDRLVLRSVCSQLKISLSSWNGFLDSVSFRIPIPKDPKEQRKVFSTLRNSAVPWRTVKVDCLSRKVLISNVLSTRGPVYSSVKELELCLHEDDDDADSPSSTTSSRSWSVVQEFITRFEHLEKLTLNGLNIELIPHEGWSQSPKQVTKFHELRQCLKELRIKTSLYESKQLSTLTFCLERFTGE